MIDTQPVWALSIAGDGLLAAGPVIEPAGKPVSLPPYWDDDPTPPTIRDPVLSPGWLRWLNKDSTERAKVDLPSSPTQDGIMAIGGKVWMTLQDGSVVCLGQ